MKLKDGDTYKSFGDGLEKTIRAVGKCALCRLECFDDGNENDPRGACGLRVAAPVIASEQGQADKPDVMACYGCHQNDGEKYEKLMAIVREIWSKS